MHNYLRKYMCTFVVAQICDWEYNIYGGDIMPTTKAGQKAVNKYIAKAYDRVNLVLKKDTSPTKDEVQAAADAEGVSLNAYIVAAISQQLNKDKP